MLLIHWITDAAVIILMYSLKVIKCFYGHQNSSQRLLMKLETRIPHCLELCLVYYKSLIPLTHLVTWDRGHYNKIKSQISKNHWMHAASLLTSMLESVAHCMIIIAKLLCNLLGSFSR